MTLSPRACRHCGSPAKGNPCWWNIKPRNWSGDPPCVVLDEANDTIAYLARQPRIAIAACSAAIIVIIAAVIWAISER